MKGAGLSRVVEFVRACRLDGDGLQAVHMMNEHRGLLAPEGIFPSRLARISHNIEEALLI
jgi:hypothetical protein